MIVRVEIPDSVGPDLDRLRALVGDTDMRMRVVTEVVPCTREEWDEYRALKTEVKHLRELWRDERLITRLFEAHMRGDVAVELRDAVREQAR